MKLGEPDDSGRRKPIIKENSEFKIEADIVIKALGFDPEELPKLFGEEKLQVTKWGTIKTDFDTMETNIAGIFAAGDIIRGLIASTEGKKTRRVVEYGIQALKAVWHRGAIDADGKTGDGAGIHIEIPTSFFKEKIENYGRQYDSGEICVGMIFLPRNDYNSQEKCKTLIETELLKNNYNIYRWRQVPINTSVLGPKAELTRPEIVQVIFKSKNKKLNGKDLERQLYVIRRTIEKKVLNF